MAFLCYAYRNQKFWIKYKEFKHSISYSKKIIYRPNTVNRNTFNIQNGKLQQPIQSIDSKPTDLLPPEEMYRKNLLGMQMLSKPIHKQIFPEGSNEICDRSTLKSIIKELAKHNMKSDDADRVPDVNLKIPPLKGKNIEEHFMNIGNEQVNDYKQLIFTLLETRPEPPHCWSMETGWTMYKPGCDPIKVDYPLEQSLVFDVEVCVRAGQTPVLATAVSNQAWYGWVSPALIDGTTQPNTSSNQYSINSLIPIESTSKDDGAKLNKYQLKPKIIIGHNVSYDRARIKEQYWLNKTETRFLDTMSLHICISGLTSYQRAIMKSLKFENEDDSWKDNSSLNNLVDVYKLYCNKTLNKEPRNLLIEGNMLDIKNDFQNIMQYCCTDVIATYDILNQLFPIFLERFPHPVTLAGMLELSTAYLPINENWNRYIADAEQSFDDLESEGRILLARRADQACQLMHDEKYKEDLWLWDEDWSVHNLKAKKLLKKETKQIENMEKCETKQIDDENYDELEEKFKTLWETKKNLCKIKSHLPGYPNWYRKLCTKPDQSSDWIPGPHLLSTAMKITPKLLSLTWEGYPLHYLKNKGWGFLIPFGGNAEVETKLPIRQLLEKFPLLNKEMKMNDIDSTLMENISNMVDSSLMKREFYSKLKKDNFSKQYAGSGIWCNEELENCCWFLKLPHKDGASKNVGNPLAKDFLNKFSENVLVGDTEIAQKILTIAKKLSYWRNNRDRILDQMVIWLPQKSLPRSVADRDYNLGAIIPQVVVCGTLTRRAVERTWMTASNAHPDRIGSELRAMVQAPPGYHIIGADVDSQELWISSVLGDADYAKMHGATPLGWMTLSGSKAKKTDMHSVTAQAVGISRDHAKVINYARIYGAGQQFAERLLKQFNPLMSDSEARSKARKMFTLTKGKKYYYLKSKYLSDLDDKPYSKWEANEVAKAYGKNITQMFNSSKWISGTESAMFNRLEEIANSAEPRTPFLEGRLTRALEFKTKNEDRFSTTRINWVVQSGAVDFLHLLLVCMKWIMGNRIRFCISFHDEVRYIVPEKYRYQAALALHISNLLTRSFCVHKLGLRDLPQAVAFFSSVEIDTVLRKECDNDCLTPSNPHGLEKGYNIKKGESLNIYQAVEKAAAYYPYWYNDNKMKKYIKILSR